MNKQIEIFYKTAQIILKNGDCMKIPDCVMCFGFKKSAPQYCLKNKKLMIEHSKKAIKLWNSKKIIDFLECV